MDLLVGLLIQFVVALPLGVAVVPPVVMASRHRWTPPAVAAWLAGVVLLGCWVAAGSADLDRADATGGQGSIWAGIGWLVAAVAAASAAVVLSGRPRDAARAR